MPGAVLIIIRIIFRPLWSSVKLSNPHPVNLICLWCLIVLNLVLFASCFSRFDNGAIVCELCSHWFLVVSPLPLSLQLLTSPLTILTHMSSSAHSSYEVNAVYLFFRILCAFPPQMNVECWQAWVAIFHLGCSCMFFFISASKDLAQTSYFMATNRCVNLSQEQLC